MLLAMGSMTLPEWTRAIVDELAAAGFEVREYKGFPLAIVPKTATFEDRVRFLKFRTALPADREIYEEGVLFTPAGSRQRWHDREAG